MSAQREQFIATYGPAAQKVAQQLNVPYEGVINHWGLETGWGKSVVPGTNNLGNIKDFSGGGVAATDNMTKTRDKYRVYETPDAFAQDYAKLIGSNPRYAAALNTNTAYDFANALQKGGYAEDPNFARKVAGMPLPVQSQSALPNTMANAQMNQGGLRTQQLSPDDMAVIREIQNSKASMLPLALGAMKSSNRGSRESGMMMFREAMEGLDPMRVGRGIILPSGKYMNEWSDLDLARHDNLRQDIERKQLENAPADLIQTEAGQVLDPNAPWKGLTNRQALTMKNQTMQNENKRLDAMREVVASDTATKSKLDRFSELNQKEGTGTLWDKFSSPLLHYGDTAVMQSLTSDLTPLQKPDGSGSTSNFEQQMYAMGLPRIENGGNVNAQIRLAKEAMIEARKERLSYYEKYLAKHGHLNGVEEMFQNEVIPRLEEKFNALNDYYGYAEKKGNAAAVKARAEGRIPRGSGQVSNAPSSSSALPKSTAAANGGFSIEPVRE